MCEEALETGYETASLWAPRMIPASNNIAAITQTQSQRQIKANIYIKTNIYTSSEHECSNFFTCHPIPLKFARYISPQQYSHRRQIHNQINNVSTIVTKILANVFVAIG